MTRRPAWILSLLAVLIAVAVVIVPPFVMQPFRAQGANELRVALAVLRCAPLLLGLALVLAGWAVVRAWPRGWARRAGTLLALGIVIGAGALAQINIFEKMFAPMTAPRFAGVAETGLADDAVVMAVAVGEARRAYPVHVMAYHHVLNDVVGETPLVVTY